MSPWKSVYNSFFHVSYSILDKQFRLGVFWKGRVYSVNFRFSFHVTDLISDGLYPTEYERYKKEGYYGKVRKSQQRPHQTGIYYNWNDKQLSTLPPETRQAELDRRKACSIEHRTGLSLGQNPRT